MPTQTYVLLFLAVAIAFLLAYFQYGYLSKLKGKKNLLYGSLRFLTLFILFLLLINPKLEQKSYYTEKPNLVIAIDNTASLSFLKQKQNIEEIIQQFKTNKPLNNKFTIDYYTFGNTLHQTDSVSFTEKQTNINEALQNLAQVYKNKIAPIVVLTDGNQTYGSDYVYNAKTIKQPIYPIVFGDTAVYPDIKIKQLNTNKYAFLKNKFPVEAILQYTGTATITRNFKITKGQETVFSKNIEFSPTNTAAVISANIPATTIGVQTYSASIQPLAKEKNTTNNKKNFAIEVIDQKTKIAIIASFLHPDLGALKKSIESNEQRFVDILKPNQFLKNAQNYQMVILYQPDVSFQELYKNPIFSSLNSWTILGAKTNYNFVNTTAKVVQNEITTATEYFQAIANTNYATFILDNLDFETFPPLLSTFGNANFTIPEDVVLFKKIGTIATNKPLLTTLENNGKREAFLFGENIWQWRAQSFQNKKSFYQFDNFIGKIIQYLATTKQKERLLIDYESYYQGQEVLVKAQVFNKTYEFNPNDQLEIKVTNTKTQEKSTSTLVLKNNFYEADLSNLPSGTYNFIVTSKTEQQSKSGKFYIVDQPIEKQFSNANYKKLEQLATATNGAIYLKNNFLNLSTNLENNKKLVSLQKSTKKVVPLIDWKYLLGLLILSLALEWFIRKYNGLV